MRFFAAFIALVSLAFSTPSTAQTMAEGQSHADYLAWLARDPGARAQVISFKTFLDTKDLDEVLPTWQLVRTASMWRECNGPRFEVAPFTEWDHLAKTLAFVKTHVQPVVGPVEALSGFRNEGLNQCAGGAKQSAHRHFYALDLTPLEPIGRAGMIRSVCSIHAFRGRDYDIGLGFYSGMRFHVDSKGFRMWGPDGKGATSPCATGNYG
ncbi:D-Ala-D-Ala carboxypeptidase family metallohydrolase [Allosphingosinicella vermicomposti]|uniref:D-Ala-D-Ala carboxypeptidase family metallohydrolase n=1 Tax=Allosphingosinicella vermicomposti TaxID=614671 RepID=UPI000D0EB192|nr:D-Ala-D-Ala carboxypeptidase family metallohydrolase [Allosphingosinicella vermicomposti]